MRSTKAKQVLHLGPDYLMPTVQPEPQLLESFAGKFPGIPEEKQQSLTEPWALTAANANGIVGCISKECAQQVDARDCSPLFGMYYTAAGSETASGASYSVLGSPVQETYGQTGASPDFDEPAQKSLSL